MPADLSSAAARHAASSAATKRYDRSACENRSHPSENASFGAGEVLVSGSGSQGANRARSAGRAAGGLESGGDQSGGPKSGTHTRFGVPTAGAPGDFVDRVRA